MRLIDADQFGVVSFQSKSEEFIDGVCFVLDKIYEAPTVEERPRGEWVYDEKSNVYRCSRCRHFPSRIITEKDDKIFTDFNRSDTYIFCPHCGSDNRKRAK